MLRILCLTLMLALAIAAGHALYPDFASDPAISPDGRQVCFVYDGDLWLVAFAGGEARRITSTTASEWGPSWSPDGKWLAFNSTREGGSYPYLMPAQGGPATPIIAGSYTVSDWFADSQHLLCVRYDLRFGNSFYKLPLTGARPQLLAEIGDRYASLSPDNRTIVFNRNGNPHREALTGSLAGELWQLDLATKQYSRLTYTPYTERYPRWSHASNSLYFCASDSDRFQICRVDSLDFSTRKQVSEFAQWSARDISIARNSDRMVFELFNELWKYDPYKLLGDKFSRLEIDVNQDLWQQETRRQTMQDDFHSFAVSPDELLVAFQYQYDTFFIPRKGGEVRQITNNLSSTGQLDFLADKRTLLFRQLDQGLNKLFTVRCDSSLVVQPLAWIGADSLDVESFTKDPSGKWVIYYGDNRLSSRIAIADPELKEFRLVGVPGPVVSNFAINPSGDYAVYATTREDNWTRELWLYDFARDQHLKLINDDAWIRNLAWSSDERSLLLSRSGGIFRLDLVPRDELEFEVDNWREILNPPPADSSASQEQYDAAPDSLDTIKDTVTEADSLAAEPEPETTPPRELHVVWEGLERRLFPVLSEPEYSLTVQSVIDDSTFYYLAEGYGTGGTTVLKKANIYGKNPKQEFDLGARVQSYSWQGKTLYYLQDGVIRSYNTVKGTKGELRTQFIYQYNTRQLNAKVFEQVWGVFGLNFYDPDMHGQDWQHLYQLYRPYAERARSIEDIAAIVNEMIGDVNASHTGFYPRREGEGNNRQTAWLGLEFDYSRVLPEGIAVRLVYPTSRLASYYQLRDGDIITRINGTAITAQTPIDSLLLDQVGKRVTLRFQSGDTVRDAVVTGLSYSEQRRLQYIYQTNRSRQLVDLLTENRIGYVHIPGMGSRDFDNFQREVFRDNADKEALIIDVRGNSGGHVHDQIITLLSKQPYAWSTSRRYSGERNLEPRRAWTRPSIVLVDEGSFSDGEIFPTVYQELKLGKVVGMPSSGSVIGTWEYELLDGSSIRMPGSGWYRLDGTNMEGNGVQPDILVELSPEDEIAGRDPQLLRAIEEILKELQ